MTHFFEHSPIDEIIESYPAIANKLNMTIAVQAGNEFILIGHRKCEVLHNNPIHSSHLIGNGGENIYLITVASGEQRYDRGVFSVPQVNIYHFDKRSSINTLDLRNVVKVIQDDFKTYVDLPRIYQDGNDLLVKLEAKMGQNFLLEVLTVRLKNGLNWYEKLHIISNNAPMKISSELELKPLPLIFDKDKEIIVVTDQDVEKGTELIISKKGGNYTFVRSNDNDLIITNAFDLTTTKNDLCSIILSKFYEIPEIRALSIKFADKEIVLKDHEKEISTARDVNVMKKEYEDQVYNDVFSRYKQQNVTIRHRRHKEYSDLDKGFSENIKNSSARVSSWINDLFDWVKISIGGLLDSKSSTTIKSPISQIDAQIDVNDTIMLLDLLVRKITGQKCISTVDQPISPLEAQGYALNIIEKFEKVLSETAIKSGISVTNLNFDPVAVQSAIFGKIRNGEFSQVSKTLYSFAKEACPEFKQTDKFLAYLKSQLEGEKETALLQQKVEKPSKILDQQVSRKVKLSKKTNTFLNGTSVVKGISSVLAL